MTTTLSGTTGAATTPQRTIQPASARQMPGAPPGAPSTGGETAAGATRPEDTVSLSPEAVKALDGAISFAVPKEPAALDNASPEFLAHLKMAELMPVRQQWHEQLSKYHESLNDLVRKTFEMPEGYSWMAGGAAFAMLDKLGAAHGLSRPEMPQALIDAGETDPFAEDAQSETGVFGLVDTSPSAPLNFSDRTQMQIVFNRESGIPAERLRLNALTAEKEESGPLIGRIKDSPLARFIDTTDGQAGSRTSLFAVTDGTGPNARVAGAIRSTGMDGFVADSALKMLKTITQIMQG